jgi:putative two-component system response regulator
MQLDDPLAGDELAALRRERARPEVVTRLLDLAKAAQDSDAAQSRALAEEARAMALSLGDVAGQAHAAYRLAAVAYLTGRVDVALAHAIEARALAGLGDALVVEAWALNLIGVIHVNAGNYSEALGLCLDALDTYRRTDHRGDEGNFLNTIASIHSHLGDLDRGLRTYEEALEVNRGLGRPEHEALIIANIACLRTKRGDGRLAVTIGKQAVEMSRSFAPSYLPEVLATLGEAYDAAGEPDAAAELFDEAVARSEQAERDGHTVTCTAHINALLSRGRSHLAARRFAAAQADLQSALTRAELERARQLELDAHAALTVLYKEMGRFEEALAHADARFELNHELFNEGTDLRIRTLQIVHDTEHARQEAEIYRLRTSELEAMVQERTRDLEAFQIEALTRLAILGEFRDTDTGEHTVRVGDMAARIARGLGLEPDIVDRLRLAARLHDIGKVGIPDSILLKPGPLTPAEFEVMKTHTTIGARILAGSSSPLVQMAEEVALNHHERWDGTGYPNGRAGHVIPLSGRITTVADVFDALTSVRPYKRAWSVEEAVRYIAEASGTQFEPRIVEVFLDIVNELYPQLPFDAEPVLAAAASYPKL